MRKLKNKIYYSFIKWEHYTFLKCENLYILFNISVKLIQIETEWYLKLTRTFSTLGNGTTYMQFSTSRIISMVSSL